MSMFGYSGYSTGGNLTGAAANDYSSAYGGIPQVPNPTSTAAQANAGNAANLSGIEGTASNLNAFNQSQLLNQYNTAIPNYSALTQTASNNTQQQLSGQVPTDVINQLLTSAAERGISGGSPGSANSNAAYLQALGLTSIGQQQTGMSNLHQLTADAPIAKQYDPSSMFVTPEQQQSAQTASNLYAAAPQPEAAAQNAINLATPAKTSNMPWWAQAGQPTNLGTGSYLSGSTWHTPRGAGG